MKIEEFVKLDAKQIRHDKELMQLFVNFYEAAFSFTPKCVGCSFKSGFKKLKRYIENQDKNIKFIKKTNIMSTKTFVLKNAYKLKILTYKKEGKTYRCYGYNLTDEFANELIKSGKSEYFNTLPKTIENIDIIEETVVDGFENKNYRTEIIPLYNELKEKTGLKAKSFKKEDILSFIKEHAS